MQLDEAIERLNKAGYLVEGSYKEIIHQQLQDLRQEKGDASKSRKSLLSKINRVKKAIFEQVKEFVSDLQDELVMDDEDIKASMGFEITVVLNSTNHYEIIFKGNTIESWWGHKKSKTADIDDKDQIADLLDDYFKNITAAAADIDR